MGRQECVDVIGHHNICVKGVKPQLLLARDKRIDRGAGNAGIFQPQGSGFGGVELAVSKGVTVAGAQPFSSPERLEYGGG